MIQIENVKIAKTMLEKIKGLMFEKKPKRILFVFDKDIDLAFHSLFVNFEFEMYFLDKNFKVLEIKKIKPWNAWIKPSAKYRYVLETELGFGKKKGIRKGDKLIIVY